jgi:hypothetical protein
MFMSFNPDIAERRQQMLAKVAELDLAACEAAHASYLRAIDTPEEAEKGRTYQRMARSLRQSLALHERFDRLAAQEAREAAREARQDAILNRARPDPEPEPPRRRFPVDIEAADARAGELRTAVRRVIWSEGFDRSELEVEREFAGQCYRQLEDWLLDERCDEDFTTHPLDEYVTELCAEMNLDPDNAARWRELSDPDIDMVRRWLKDLKGYARPPWQGSG